MTKQIKAIDSWTPEQVEKELASTVAIIPTEIVSDPPEWLGAMLLLWESGYSYDALASRLWG